MDTTEAITKLQALIDSSPTTVNPTKYDKSCLYTGYDGVSHCIVGQLGADEGWSIPGPGEQADYADAMTEWEWPISDDTADYLAAVQLIADGPVGEDPIPWGEIVLPDPVEVKRTADEQRAAEQKLYGYYGY